jgi:hypothetical protein
MAHPIIVTHVTTVGGAGFGPGENHGMRSYSLKMSAVNG